MVSIFDRIASGANRLAHAWNAFMDSEEKSLSRYSTQYGASYGISPSRRRLSTTNDRSIIASVYTRLGIDFATYELRHAKVDANGNYLEDIKSGLNECLSLRANVDQTARAFKQDIAMTLFEKGAIAIVPIDTTLDPNITGSYDINTIRVGEVVSWYARHVRVNLWNDVKGRFEEVTVPKSVAAIVENPFYQVMNEPNSTLQRLLRKLNILDAVDEASSSGKLDLIIQLPYVIKSQARKEEAEKRAKDIEMQLKGSKYGIAYTDGTERITQLNRPAENNLLNQVQYLEKMLFAQLGLTEAVILGEGDEKAMLNYYSRTIEPVLTAVTEAMRSTFLTKTGRTQGQSIVYYRDPFKLVAVADIAEIADKFARNEIMTSNEIRSKIGLRPHPDPKADQLINSNMPQPTGPAPVTDPSIDAPIEEPNSIADLPISVLMEPTQ